MSYNTMDHAGWVESNNSAHNSMERNKKRPGKLYPEKLTDFQAKVMDILGMVCGGIYNAPISWDKVEWNCWAGLSVILRDGRLATYDFYQLTRLVFLCHEARIRCELTAHTRGYFRIMFHPRVHEGGMTTRHPNLDEAVIDLREYLPAGHRIFYQESPQP